MIPTNHQIVWTPVLTQKGLAVALRQDFAQACINAGEQDIKKLSQTVWQYMGDMGTAPSGFLDSYEGTLLPKGIYTGSDGVWLTMDRDTLKSTKQPLMYYGHNEDLLKSRIWLLAAFQAWANAAMVMLYWI